MRHLIEGLTRKARRSGNGSLRVRPPRRRRVRPWERRAVHIGGATLIVMLVVGSGAWMWSLGWVATAAEGVGAALIQTTAAAGLTVREVYVTGREKTAPEAILDALGVERGSPLVALDPATARRRIEALGWVREASVERRFPDTVFVRLQERVPLALWQRKGKLRFQHNPDRHSCLSQSYRLFPFRERQLWPDKFRGGKCVFREVFHPLFPRRVRVAIAADDLDIPIGDLTVVQFKRARRNSNLDEGSPFSQ